MGLKHALAPLCCWPTCRHAGLCATPISNPGPSAQANGLIYPGSYNSQRHSPTEADHRRQCRIGLQVKWVYHIAGHEIWRRRPWSMTG